MSKSLWHGRWQGRTPVGDVHRRAREVISPSGGIVRGKFPSRKNGRMVHHEGLLELDAIYLFETSPLIVRYREQPSTIQYPDGARLRRYTPDFELLLSTDKLVIVEVKPTRSLEDKDVRHKFDRIEEHLLRSAAPFVILTEKAIRQEPRLSSLRWIYHGASRVRPTDDALRVALNRHREHFPISIRTVSPLLNKSRIDPCSLLLAGLLRCELDTQVGPDTLLNLTTELHHDWFWIAEKYGF